MPRNQSERVKPFGPYDPGVWGYAPAQVEDLLGHTVTDIIGAEVGCDVVLFIFKDATFKMHHEQDCCERVDLDDVIGDIEDLIGSPLTMAEEVSDDDMELTKQQKAMEAEADSCTWTFYKFATMKGYVTLRWYGESNGYYSESVSFARTD